MRNLIIIVLMAISFNTYAIDFKGVKIGDTVLNANTELLKNGFAFDSILSEGYSDKLVYVGDFIGENCDVTLTHNKGIITKITIGFPVLDEWTPLKNIFNEIREVLCEKWGEPKKDYKLFPKPFRDGDGFEMLNVSLCRCGYYSFWHDKHSNNRMVLRICEDAFVEIIYN